MKLLVNFVLPSCCYLLAEFNNKHYGVICWCEDEVRRMISIWKLDDEAREQIENSLQQVKMRNIVSNTPSVFLEGIRAGLIIDQMQRTQAAFQLQTRKDDTITLTKGLQYVCSSTDQNQQTGGIIYYMRKPGDFYMAIVTDKEQAKQILSDSCFDETMRASALYVLQHLPRQSKERVVKISGEISHILLVGQILYTQHFQLDENVVSA